MQLRPSAPRRADDRVSTRRTALPATLAILGLTAVAARAQEDVPATPLSRFYVKDVYAPILRASLDERPAGTVRSKVSPVFGVRSTAPFDSPTFVGSNGLRAVLLGDLRFGIDSADWLLEHTLKLGLPDREDAALLYFDVEYGSKYPYAMAAPWTSGLSQGLGLELCAQLFARTGEQRFRDAADALFRGYLVPVSEGGFLRRLDSGPLFEEYPTRGHLTGVFNGYAVAALALRGYALLCDRPEAERLLQDSLDGFAELAGKLEAELDVALQTRYGLAGRRFEGLFRLVRCEGEVQVDSVELRAAGEIVARVDVGGPGDLDVLSTGYVWENPVYQGWGPRRSGGGADWRDAHGYPEARYRHAPITLALPEQQADLQLEVRWRGDGDGQVAVHSGGWRSLGTLSARRTGGADSGGWYSSGFEVPFAWTGDRDPERLLELVERKYLDDNAELMELLASVHQDDEEGRLARFARRWSADWIEFYRQGGDPLPPNFDRRNGHWPLVGATTLQRGDAPADAVLLGTSPALGASPGGGKAGLERWWADGGLLYRDASGSVEIQADLRWLEPAGSVRLLDVVLVLPSVVGGAEGERGVLVLASATTGGFEASVVVQRSSAALRRLQIEGRPLAAVHDVASSLGFVLAADGLESGDAGDSVVSASLWMTDELGRATKVRTVATGLRSPRGGFVRWTGVDQALFGVFTDSAIELYWFDPVRKDTAPAGRVLVPHGMTANAWRTADGVGFAQAVAEAVEVRRLDFDRLATRLLDFEDAFRAFSSSWYGDREWR